MSAGLSKRFFGAHRLAVDVTGYKTTRWGRAHGYGGRPRPLLRLLVRRRREVHACRRSGGPPVVPRNLTGVRHARWSAARGLTRGALGTEGHLLYRQVRENVRTSLCRINAVRRVEGGLRLVLSEGGYLSKWR